VEVKETLNARSFAERVNQIGKRNELAGKIYALTGSNLTERFSHLSQSRRNLQIQTCLGICTYLYSPKRNHPIFPKP